MIGHYGGQLLNIIIVSAWISYCLGCKNILLQDAKVYDINVTVFVYCTQLGPYSCLVKKDILKL